VRLSRRLSNGARQKAAADVTSLTEQKLGELQAVRSDLASNCKRLNQEL
jgi:hypothetical protein